MARHTTTATLLIPGLRHGAEPRGSFGIEHYTQGDIELLTANLDRLPAVMEDDSPRVGHVELEEGRIKAFVNGPVPLSDDQVCALLHAVARRALPAWRLPVRIEVVKHYPASQPTRVVYGR